MLYVVVVVIVVLVAIGVYLLSRSGGMPSRTVAGAIATKDVAALTEVDFKVEGSTAHVYFDTTIPAAGADDMLKGLMGREAMRVFHEKADHLPLAAVKHVTAHGKRDGSDVAVTTVDVMTPSEMDHMDAPASGEVVKAGQVTVEDDPLAALHAMDFGRSTGYRGGSDDLPPLSQELTIPAKVIEAVAGPGGTVVGMSLQDFISGLLRASGYEVSLSSDGTGTARKGGATTFVQFVDHKAGSHPELDEKSVDSFVMKFVSSGADRGMLFTPKFGPYAIYDKERRNANVKYMTRERLQAFVDSVAMG